MLTVGCYRMVMEQALGSWRQEGQISLWRYRKAPKMYAGWHFAADQKGCACLLRLCDFLSSEGSPAYRTLTVTDPATVGVDRIFGQHDFRLNIPAKMRIGNNFDETSTIGIFDDVFILLLKSGDMFSFSEAVRDLSIAHADFGVGFGSDDTIIKFWWWAKQY